MKIDNHFSAEYFGLNNQAWKVVNYNYQRSVGVALLSYFDSVPAPDDKVDASVVTEYALTLARLNSAEMFPDHFIALDDIPFSLISFNDIQAEYIGIHQSICKVPYSATANHY